MENQKSNGFGVLLILILIALCGYFVWMYFTSDNSNKDTSNDKTNKKDTISEKEALKQIEEKYMLAINTYKIKDKFNLASEKTPIEEEEYYEITDYKEVTNEIFSANGKKQFEDYYKEDILKKDNKTYIKAILIDMETQYKDNYQETIFAKKTIKKDKIVYEAKSTYEESDEVKEDFILVKKDKKWLIDKFHFPYQKS